MPANHSRFALQLADLDTDLRVVGFRYQDRIDGLFHCQLEVAVAGAPPDLAGWLNRAAALTLHHRQHPSYLHGQVVQLTQGAVGRRFTTCFLTLRPRLWLLGLRRGLRIFQQQSVPQIVDRVLTAAGVPAKEVSWQLSGSYPAREYSVQYRESDLDFVSRLLWDAGLFFHIRQRRQGPLLVIGDHDQVFQSLPGAGSLPFRPDSGQAGQDDSVSEFRHWRQQQTEGAVSRDYYPPHPRWIVEAAAGAHEALVEYEYPGGFQRQSAGLAQMRRRRQALRGQRQQFRASTDCQLLAPGRRFRLRDHPSDTLNREYLVTGIEVEAAQPQVLEEGAGAGGSRFSASLWGLPAAEAYQPVPARTKPRVSGVQTAVVTGPPGEEIYTDATGRVKVQFHWDREGRGDGYSSCWLRVAQAWAGNGWGSWRVPRVGQEVLVQFMDGDPDRPLVTGALYNGRNRPSQALPELQARSGLKSRSSPGGEGCNELRLDDRRGREQILVRAQRDLDLAVGRDGRHSAGRELHRQIEAGGFQQVGQDLHRHIAGNLTLDTGADWSQQVGGRMQQAVAGQQLMQAGELHSVKAGNQVVLEAGVSLTLNAGGSRLHLDPGGVALTGSRIRINSGGGGRGAAAANPRTPKAPAPVPAAPAGAGLLPHSPGRPPRRETVRFDRPPPATGDPDTT